MPDTAEAVAQYGSAVYRLAYAMTRSRSDADDVFQEVFLRLHRSAPDFANEEHRRAWLLRVTANCARSLLASPWRMRTLPLEDVYSYQDSVESAVDEALAHLPGKYRAVIHLFYYEGLSDGGDRPDSGPVSLHRPGTADPGPAEVADIAEGGYMNFFQNLPPDERACRPVAGPDPQDSLPP